MLGLVLGVWVVVGSVVWYLGVSVLFGFFFF